MGASVIALGLVGVVVLGAIAIWTMGKADR